MHRNPERARNLVIEARSELEKFKAGEITDLTGYRGYATKYGVSTSLVYQTLRRAGLTTERKTLLRKEMILSPSRDLAWLLAVLGEGGCVNPTGFDEIRFVKSDEHLRKAVSTIGENIFGVNANILTTQNPNRPARQGVYFFSSPAAWALGDLRKPGWVDTVLERHSWVLANENYKWGLIGGFFDIRGTVLLENHTIFFSTSYHHTTGFISDLLVNLGVKHPRLVANKRSHEGISGIGISNARDTRHLALNIHSKVPYKEEGLSSLRGYQPMHMRVESHGELIDVYKKAREMSLKERARLPSSNYIDELRRRGLVSYASGSIANHFGGGKFIVARDRLEEILTEGGKEVLSPQVKYRGRIASNSTPQELMEEWGKLVTSLHHSPSVSEIQKLRKEGRTSFYPNVYANRFGEGNFARAKFFLDVNLALRQYEESSEKQIRFVHKQHPAYDYDSRDRLNKILSKKEPVADDSSRIKLFSVTENPILLKDNPERGC